MPNECHPGQIYLVAKVKGIYKENTFKLWICLECGQKAQIINEAIGPVTTRSRRKFSVLNGRDMAELDEYL